MHINEIIEIAVAQNASDIHLASDSAPWFRINGKLQQTDFDITTNDELQEFIRDLIGPIKFKQLLEPHEIDFAVQLRNQVRLRINAFHTTTGLACAIRIISKIIPSIADLSLPTILYEIANNKDGLVLITGPTGSGKSTTLAAMINYLNSKINAHIITIEDPIEFIYKSDQCLINQREVLQHTQNFNNALRAALREDPDIIVIGELRDLETIRLALTAAETGHLIFATLHTNSAIKSITRIIDVFPAEEKSLIKTMLADSLKAVISQQLITTELKQRKAITEILINTNAIRNLIREEKLTQIYSIMQTNSNIGMHTFEQSITRN